MSAGIWPAELQEFRERHVRSDAHIAILRIAAIEQHIQEQFGIAADATDVPDEVRRIAALLFVQATMTTPEQSQKIDDELQRLLAKLKGSVH
jgi:predicted RNase H-like nuclease (RuvC/YqgF family)